MLDRFSSPSLEQLAKNLKDGSFLLERSFQAPLALIAALIQKKQKRPVVIITANQREDNLFQNLSFFTTPIELPAWETFPSEEIPPSADILGKRFEALRVLSQEKAPLVLTTLAAFNQKIIPKEELKKHLETWKTGDQIPFDLCPDLLRELSYERVPLVTDKGQFAIRGGIIDVFPVAAKEPYRIEFFDDEIETIRTFDPIGQKTTGKAAELFLSSANELALLKKAPHLVHLCDYFEEPPLLIWEDLLTLEDALVSLKKMPGFQSVFFEELIPFFQKHRNVTHLFCCEDSIDRLSENASLGSKEVSFEIFDHSFLATRLQNPFRRIDLFEEIQDPNLSFHFIHSTEKEKGLFAEKLPLPKNTSFEEGYLSEGFAIGPHLFVPISEITHQKKTRRQEWRSVSHTPPSDFHELTPGDLVVHFHSGISRYLGMEEQANHLGKKTEFLVLEYADKAKLFVPLSQSYLLSRYVGSESEVPSLSQLGSKKWQKTRLQAQSQIVGYAQDLLQLYAKREAFGGFQYAEDSDLMQQFEESFPYPITKDQALAIEAIKKDMLSEKVMERLICGDVGYGKTEVAMRAAFKAVVDGGKQVALLVPTTLLAMQHYETFSERMKNFPVKVGLISRFQKPKEIRIVLEEVEEGRLDILIGTHRLLSKDLTFQNLGLIIIDEEQRFGVRAKEKLKNLSVSSDYLALSATPIPRTLYLSLVEAKNMSVINTPPQDRLPIKTVIAKSEDALIQNACLREFARGGQVFFIHNRVETIYEKAKKIHQLIPEARIAVVHGQLDATEIDTIFHRFKNQEIDCLFATTILESGIDVPNANTILIDRADTYGLSDLYQLKGRVGRWNRTAYAYFLIPHHELSEVARKRLHALVEAGAYGGGMKVAMRDLEIRGAGDFLGTHQSGHISSIGFHLYCKLLKKAIAALKKNTAISFLETKIEGSFDARLPSSYIPEVSLRLEIYHRLGEVTTFEEIEEVFEELKDRFGELPPEAIWLYHISRIRTFASEHQIQTIKLEKRTFSIEKGTLKKSALLAEPIRQDPSFLEHYLLNQIPLMLT